MKTTWTDANTGRLFIWHRSFSSITSHKVAFVYIVCRWISTVLRVLDTVFFIFFFWLRKTTLDDSPRAQSEQIQTDSEHFANPFVQFASWKENTQKNGWFINNWFTGSVNRKTCNNCWNICWENISQVNRSPHA